ncbi:DUF221-domain-containing protein [Abortiporus biennis]|nr:DUF221-domain-containing protein [Abortiporus biennis]
MSSNSELSGATSATTETFVTALVFNAIVFGAELAAFTLLRPYFPAIYQPRTYIVPDEDRRPKPISSKFYAWPLAVFKADYRDIKHSNGLDAYFFVRFLRMMSIILLPIWIFSWIILLPATAVNTSVAEHTGLDRFIFGNVANNKQNRYAAHLILTYFFTFWVWWNIKKEMKHFITTRQRWLIDPVNSSSAQANTVLITGIPRRYLTEAALFKLFSHLPGGVRKVWLNRDLKEMPDIYDRRLKALNKLESAETALLSTAAKLRNKKLKKEAKLAKKAGKTDDAISQSPTNDGRPLTDPSIDDAERGDVALAEKLVPQGKRPSHRLPPFSFLPFSLPLVGKKVDSIEWAREEIEVTNNLLHDARKTLAREVAITSKLPDQADAKNPESQEAATESQTYNPLNSAFVLFNQQIAAHLAAQSLTHHEPYRMGKKYINLAPEDVIWSNLNMNPYEARVRMAIGWGITAGLIILWAFPVAFVGAVSNIHALCVQYSWLAWICGLPPIVVGIISGILPPLLLAILMMLLPIILRLLSKFEGTPQRTGVELSLMTRFFIFQVIHSFLIVTLASGIIAALPQLLNNPGSIPTLLAQNLPKASTFFLTYVILQGLSGTAAGFLTIVPLIMYYFKLFILGSTPRSIYGIKYTGRTVSWGTLYPVTTLLVVISLAYSIISPIINGLAFVTFFLFFLLWKYLFIWQLDSPKSGETGGLFFPKAIQHVFVGMYIQQICLAALFFLARNSANHPSAIAEGALMIVLIVFTAFFHMIINNSYGPLIDYLPLSLAEKTGGLPDANRDEAERELNEQDSMIESPSEKPIPKDSSPSSTPDHAEESSSHSHPPTPTSSSSPQLDKAKAIQTEDIEARPRHSHDSRNDVNSPDSTPDKFKAIDEEAGPKEFYHPASVDPQRVVWLPRDQLGLAEAEVSAIRARGIDVSMHGATMDGKGKVDIDGSAPPEKGV